MKEIKSFIEWLFLFGGKGGQMEELITIKQAMQRLNLSRYAAMNAARNAGALCHVGKRAMVIPSRMSEYIYAKAVEEGGSEYD